MTLAKPAHLLALALAMTIAGCMHPRAATCAASPQANVEIERTVNAFFDALRKDDPVALAQVTTASFYSFDGGERLTGPELVDAVRDAHARGVQLNWSIGSLDTKQRCDIAWSAWENVGSAGIPPNVRPVRWLESAVLVRQGSAWKIDFFHSHRAAAR